MEYLFVAMAFMAGAALGLNLRKMKRAASANQVLLDIETFQYLKERDDELWEIEKSERGRIRFISGGLKERKDALIGCMN